jgi:hypothetical protein
VVVKVIPIGIPSGILCASIIGSGTYVKDVYASFAAAYTINNWSYQYRFANEKQHTYKTISSNHYNKSAIENRDKTHYLRKHMKKGFFWCTLWVEWRAKNVATATDNIE